MRDALSLLPECDATKLSLSAQYFSGEEAMLCAQRQKSSSLAQLFKMLLRIEELYRDAGETENAEKTLNTANALLESLKRMHPTASPKENARNPPGSGSRESIWMPFSVAYIEFINKVLPSGCTEGQDNSIF